MKKIFLLPLVFLGLMLFSTSCEESLAEYNIDPTNPTEVTLNLLMPEILSSSAYNEGTNPNRIAGIIMQQLVGLDAQQLAYNDYVLTSDVMDNFWRTGLYAGVLKSCDVIIKQAVVDERPFYGAVAKIVMANELGKAASMFGDIPYSEAFQGAENLNPAYDTQEAIYTSVQTLLDEAISELNGLEGDGGFIGGDLVFGGDIASWEKTAHAYKARYYMHTSKRNSGDFANAIAQVDMSFTSNAEAPFFTFDDTQIGNWSLAKFGVDRPSTLGIDNRFADMMAGDLRADLYFNIASEEDGIITYSFFDDPSGGNMFWAQNAASIPMISYVELMFIKAEANAQLNGAAPGMLADAINASYDLLQFDRSAEFITPAMDTITIGEEIDNYIAANAGTGNVQEIVEEAYKAYYGFNFHETWSNFRRTGFPELTPSAGASEGLNPSLVIPRRFLYVASEVQTNATNLEAAQSRQQGALLDVPVWAFE